MDIDKHIKEDNMAKKHHNKAFAAVAKVAKSVSSEIPAGLSKQIIRAHKAQVEECIAAGCTDEAIAKLPNGTREMVRRAYA
tara:strand:+ start:679 stop:921 length:243 start_codon:yes stop_codon:yes gene_type:complete